MKYAIKNTDEGVLVKDVPAGNVSWGKGWEVVDQLPDTPLYRETFELNDEGEYVSVKTFFTAESESKKLDEMYAMAFNRLLVSREIHEKGVGYPALAGAALAELDNGHSSAESLYQAVLSSILS